MRWMLGFFAATILALSACGHDTSTSETSSPDAPRPAPGGTGGASDAGGPADDAAPPVDGAAPADFWDASGIPAAKNVMMFKFLNRSNGAFDDSEIYWRFELNGETELHAISEQATFDMPANASGRLYFFVCRKAFPDDGCAAGPEKSKYYDFIEHTIGTDRYNGNTTRVDAFGLKIAMKLHAKDGTEQAVGEDFPTFAESREATFAKYLAEVPAEFAATAQAPNAPYRIVQPGAAGFDMGGAHEAYYSGFVDSLWAANGITMAKPGPNGDGLTAYPDLSAAIFRHVGAKAGTFDPTGKLLDQTLWTDPTTFYTAAPANYYAQFWHEHGIDGKAYGFPYDDVGGYSTYISKQNPEYLLVAIGW